ncbi:MAG: bifunctional folylpolyglutamate synthase/dihydrofolate synthase [Phycisphaeraceae bacterium]|nr:bifunctional folylpolyglutamate synthase/dihydrofolate synthase [Phycisphaeraceae bacterium]
MTPSRPRTRSSTKTSTKTESGARASRTSGAKASASKRSTTRKSAASKSAPTNRAAKSSGDGSAKADKSKSKKPTKRDTGAAKPRKKSKSAAAASTGSTSAGPTTRGGASTAGTAASINNLSAALRWLNSLVDFERQRIVNYSPKVFDLDRMRRLLASLGDPHDKFRSVHIAGTKGKGSTCAMLAGMLEGCGYTVGLFTSPHLIHISERISINGHGINNPDLTDVLKRVAAASEQLDETLTFFEALTAAAFLYFAEQAVDVAVIETGLGGRLDSTNILTPLATGITQISLDHTNVLGDDLVGIAREKAGIFKRDIPAVSVAQTPDIAAAMVEVAEKVGAPLEFTGKEIDFSYRFEATRELGPHSRVSVLTSTSKYEHLAVPLKGEHQALNCGLALALLDKLKAHDFKLPEERVVEGLSRTFLPGRMEQVYAQPRVIIDGAHNAASIQALIRALGAHIAYDSLVMIFGCGQDKDINGMLKQVALGADKVIFTKSKINPRAMEPEDLLARFNDFSGKMAQTAPNLEEAIQLAGRAVSREDLIVITGSFYLAGEARKLFLDAKSRKR